MAHPACQGVYHFDFLDAFAVEDFDAGLEGGDDFLVCLGHSVKEDAFCREAVGKSEGYFVACSTFGLDACSADGLQDAVVRIGLDGIMGCDAVFFKRGSEIIDSAAENIHIIVEERSLDSVE